MSSKGSLRERSLGIYSRLLSCCMSQSVRPCKRLSLYRVLEAVRQKAPKVAALEMLCRSQTYKVRCAPEIGLGEVGGSGLLLARPCPLKLPWNPVHSCTKPFTHHTLNGLSSGYSEDNGCSYCFTDNTNDVTHPCHDRPASVVTVVGAPVKALPG